MSCCCLLNNRKKRIHRRKERNVSFQLYSLLYLPVLIITQLDLKSPYQTGGCYGWSTTLPTFVVRFNNPKTRYTKTLCQETRTTGPSLMILQDFLRDGEIDMMNDVSNNFLSNNTNAWKQQQHLNENNNENNRLQLPDQLCNNNVTTIEFRKKNDYKNETGTKLETKGQPKLESTRGNSSNFEFKNKSISSSSFGDIMNGMITTTSSSSSSFLDDRNLTKSSAPSSFQSSTITLKSISNSVTLAEKFGIHNPLDRMALTANGNLQRLISSYYDSTVSVIVEYCELRKEIECINNNNNNNNSNTNGPEYEIRKGVSKTWDRIVHLKVHDVIFCTAKSVITVHDIHCQELVQSNQIGLGQLFRYLDILPEFFLHKAGSLQRNDANNNNMNTTFASSPRNLPSSIESFSILRDDDTDQSHNNNPNKNEGYNGGGGFWREYTLDCKELNCQIYEEFLPGLWNIKPKDVCA